MKIITDKEHEDRVNWLRGYIDNIMNTFDEKIMSALSCEDVKMLESQRDTQIKPLMKLLNSLMLGTVNPPSILLEKDEQGGYTLNEFSDNNSRK